MSDAPNACPDCGSTNRTMIQDASTSEVVWSCENGHTWRDGKPHGPVKGREAIRSEEKPAKKETAEKTEKTPDGKK